MPRRIPIFLLTGFLGSGKTTLLNRLVRARPDTRGKMAIVVNEFGDVGIDGDLLPSSMTRQVELPGGCICCILSEELDTTLMTLLDDNPEIELIIIETTGVAEPLPISWSLAREPVSQRVRLAAVITVVDAVNFLDHRALGLAVDNQVEYADLLVASKTDLLSPTSDDAPLPAPLERVLAELNPTAARVYGTPEEITLTLWQTILDPPMAVHATSHATGQRTAPAHDHDHDSLDQHEHDHDASDSVHERADGAGMRVHTHDFETISVRIDTLLDFEELAERLEELPGNYVRIKGIAHVIDGSTGSNEPRWVAFHRVGTRVSCEPLADPSDSRMVALGSGLEHSALSACVDAAVVISNPSSQGEY